MNKEDLSDFPNNEVKASATLPLELNGDTGVNAGFKEQLEAIIGQSRVIPIFSEVSGNRNNPTYSSVKFVGVNIVNVKLTGNPKYLIIQPAFYMSSSVSRDESGAPITDDTIFTTPVLIE